MAAPAIVLDRRAQRLDTTATVVAALATAAMALGAVALLGLAAFNEPGSPSWVAAAGAATMVGGWLVAFRWWRRDQREAATSARLCRRLVVAAWGLWLVIAGGYLAATVASVTPPGGTSLWCEFPNGDSYYGATSVNWVPFGLACSWPVDAGWRVPELEQDATRVERDLAFPNASPVIDGVLCFGLAALVILTVQDQRRRRRSGTRDTAVNHP